MALIRHAQAKNIARDALVLDLGDLKRQAEELKASAEQEAARIIREARLERDRIVEGAYEEGFDRGQAEGYAKGETVGLEEGKMEALGEFTERFRSIDQSFSGAFDAFGEAREELLLNAQEDGLRLILEIARRVTRRAVQIDPDALRERIREIMTRMIEPTRAIIRVHPDDVELARKASAYIQTDLGTTAHTEIRADTSLDRGDAVVETGRGSISAEIDTQIDRILRELMPDHDASTSENTDPDAI